MVVCTNDKIAAVVGGNTAFYPMGTGSSARSTCFYILKYVTKGSGDPELTLGLIQEAATYTTSNRSTYETDESGELQDSNASCRFAIFFLQRLVNRLTTKCEYNGPQTAWMLLGGKSHYSSSHVQWFNVYSAINTLKKMKAPPNLAVLLEQDEDNNFDEIHMDMEDIEAEADEEEDEIIENAENVDM